MVSKIPVLAKWPSLNFDDENSEQLIVVQRIICSRLEWTVKQTKPTYKKQGNITLFDNDETIGEAQFDGQPFGLALVPRFPRTGQWRQGARRENDMGIQGEQANQGRQGRREAFRLQKPRKSGQGKQVHQEKC